MLLCILTIFGILGTLILPIVDGMYFDYINDLKSQWEDDYSNNTYGRKCRFKTYHKVIKWILIIMTIISILALILVILEIAGIIIFNVSILNAFSKIIRMIHMTEIIFTFIVIFIVAGFVLLNYYDYGEDKNDIYHYLNKNKLKSLCDKYEYDKNVERTILNNYNRVYHTSFNSFKNYYSINYKKWDFTSRPFPIYSFIDEMGRNREIICIIEPYEDYIEYKHFREYEYTDYIVGNPKYTRNFLESIQKDIDMNRDQIIEALNEEYNKNSKTIAENFNTKSNGEVPN